MADTLKPCPKCGKPPKICYLHCGPTGFECRIRCRKCKVKATSCAALEERAELNAKERWNRGEYDG